MAVVAWWWYIGFTLFVIMAVVAWWWYIGFTLLVIIVTRVQVTLLIADLTSALASSDADRVYFEGRLESFKVPRSVYCTYTSISHLIQS